MAVSIFREVQPFVNFKELVDVGEHVSATSKSILVKVTGDPAPYRAPGHCSQLNDAKAKKKKRIENKIRRKSRKKKYIKPESRKENHRYGKQKEI